MWSVETIIHDHLKMSEVSAGWVPRNLTDHDRARRITTSQEFVDLFEQAVRDCGFVQLDHPTYSSDLAPSDYFLFHNLKSHLRGVRYPDDEALKEAAKEWLEGQTEEFYFSGINSLPEKCCKCIELSSDYIEK